MAADTVLSTRGAEPLSHIEMRFGPLAQAPTQESDAMNDAQFAELKQTLFVLLTPGYELSKLCLAEMEARKAAAAAAEQPQQNEFLEGERKAEQQDAPERAPAPESVAAPVPPAPQPDPAT